MGSQGSFCFSNYAITCSLICKCKKIYSFRDIGRFKGEGASNIYCAPTSVVTLGKAHYEHCSPLSTCIVLNELRDWDCIIESTNYAGLPTRNLNFKPPMFREKPYNLFM